MSLPGERVFSGPGPLHPALTEAWAAQIGRVLRWSPQTVALLDFTLPGPDARAVQAALVGPGGIDLLADDVQEAALAASALRAWLAGHGYAAVPVNALTGLPDDTLPAALHASLQEQGGAWPRADWQPADAARLPDLLNLRAATLSFLQGRVLNALEGQPVAGVQVWAEADGQQGQTVTDAQGHYAFTVQTGQTVQVGFVPPERYREPDVLRLTPAHAHLSVEALRLPERVSRLGEDDIRGVMMQAMQARLEARLAQFPDAWTDPAQQLAAVVTDLQDQLRTAQEHVQERQTALAQTTGTPAPAAPLSVRVRQAADRQVLATQQADLDRTLHDLIATHAQTPTSETQAAAQQEAVQRAIDTLTRVTASRSSEQRRTHASLLPLRDAQVTPRTPAAVPDITLPLPAATPAAPPAPTGPLPTAPATPPAPIQSPAPVVPPAAPLPVAAPALIAAPIQEGPLIIPRNADAPTRPAARPRPVVWMVAGALLVAALAATTLTRRAAAPDLTSSQQTSTEDGVSTPSMVDPITEPVEPAPATTPTKPQVVTQPAPGKVTPTVTVTPTPDAAPTPPVPQVTGEAPAAQDAPVTPAVRQPAPRPAPRPAPASARTAPAATSAPIPTTGSTNESSTDAGSPDADTASTPAPADTTPADAVADTAATSETIPVSTSPGNAGPSSTSPGNPIPGNAGPGNTDAAGPAPTEPPAETPPPAISLQAIPALPPGDTGPGN